MKPIVLTYGSCQSQLISHVLSRCPRIGRHFTFATLADYENVGDAEQVDRDDLGRVVVVWEQIVQGEPTAYSASVRGLLPAGCRVIRFPPFDMLSFWPFHGSDKRRRPEPPRYPHGRFPFPDSIGARLAELAVADLAVAEIVERYMAVSRAAMPDLDRLWEIDLHRLRARDALSDVRIGQWVEDTVRSQRLLYAVDHMSAIPVVHIAKLLVDATPELVAAASSIHREIDAVVSEQHFDGHNEEHVPIHPLVAEHFKLEWYSPDLLYHWHDHWWSHDQYIENYVRWADWRSDE